MISLLLGIFVLSCLFALLVEAMSGDKIYWPQIFRLGCGIFGLFVAFGSAIYLVFFGLVELGVM